jgi:iron complex transport system ATP-binding protein
MNPQPTALISTNELNIGYDSSKNPVLCLAALELKLQAGQFVCLLGANGSGKSSLLRTLAGIQKPLSGTIKIEGQPLKALAPRERAHRLSLVQMQSLQHSALSAYEYVALGRHPHTNWMGRLDARDHQKIQNALQTVAATHLAQRPVFELSDGEAQRIALARALAQEVNLFLMDEPTAFLDMGGRIELMRALRNITHQSGLGTVLSTHDLDIALRYADQIWLITKEKTIEQDIPEALALDGRLSKTISKEALQWDRESGQWQAPQTGVPQISLDATGPEKLWTQRALERCGIGISNPAGSVRYHLSVQTSGSEPLWSLNDSYVPTQQQFKSLSACIEQLKKRIQLTAE